MSSRMQEERNLRSGLDGSAWMTLAGPSGITRSGRQYTSSLEMVQLAYNGAAGEETMFVNNIFAEISSISEEPNCSCPDSSLPQTMHPPTPSSSFSSQMMTDQGGSKKNNNSQKGGDANDRLLDIMAWGITGALIAGAGFLSVTIWGYIENYLAGSWLIPRLCNFTEFTVEAIGWGGRGAASCGARSNRYAWMSRIMATIFLTGGGATVLSDTPSNLKINIKNRLKGLQDLIGGGAGKLLAFFGVRNRDTQTKEFNEPVGNDEFNQKVVTWLQQQEPQLFQQVVDSSIGGVDTSATPNPTNGTWSTWWHGILTKANQANQGKKGGGGKRRRTRHRKNKNKKSKRRMLKRKASKRRRNKRNKTRR